MVKATTKAMMGAALLALAACASQPKDIVTAGPSVDAPVQRAPAGPASAVGTGVVPGSAADFRQSVTSDTIRFALDMYDIDPEARAILDTQAAWLLRYPAVRATIEGHCDERGTREYNLALGDRRATAAKNYLVAKGVDPSRLTTISYGKERPLAVGSDEESWAQNRRAVTLVLS
jgi:peptidoglycan-associated lipoprotein